MTVPAAAMTRDLDCAPGITRRALLTGSGAALLLPGGTRRELMGWSSQVVVANKVIVLGQKDGVFVYDGPPAPGNLIVSAAAQAGTDPFGNSYPQGLYVTKGIIEGGKFIGTGEGEELILYSGTPAANNLIASTCSADAVDSEGNQILGGLTVYGSGGGTYWAVCIPSSATAGSVDFYSGAASMASWGTPVSLGAVTGGIGVNGLNVVTAADGNPQLQSAGPLEINTVLKLLAAVQSAAGLSGYLDITATDTSTNTNGGAGTGPITITAAWEIPADDAQVGTEYVIEVPYVAAMEGNNLTYGLSIDAAAAYSVQGAISGAIVGAGVGIEGTLRLHMRCTATGASGAFDCWIDGSVAQRAANITFSNSGSLVTFVQPVTVDTTTAHSVRVNTSFAAVTSGQTITGYGSKFTRSGA